LKIKIDRQELFSIPNCLSYFRILLLPIFCVVYLGAESTWDYMIAGGILIVSALTDFFDGKIARRYNAITEFGKLLDPVADKLTLVAIALCLIPYYQKMIYLVIIMLIKEVYMFAMGYVHLKHGTKLDGAKWVGKICTATLFVALAILILIPQIEGTIADLIIGFEIIMVIMAILGYRKAFRQLKNTW